MTTLVVIPARWQSSRFPGKPLADLGGKPILAHVHERCCRAVDAEQVMIATDDDRIADACRTFGARVAMTSPDCLTGTDRVAEVARNHEADWYVNVQGDEPFIEPLSVTAVIRACESAHDDVAAVNAMTPIETESDFRSSTVPKVVTDQRGRLLYISRGAIPTDKSLSFHAAHRQVGLYGFRRSSLEAFASQPRKTPLEAIEDIEILRLLELGYTIEMLEVASGGPAVDTPEDLERARAHLEASAQPGHS